MIPLSDLEQQHESIREELDEAVRDVISTCRFVGGPVIDAFARDFADYCGAEHALPLSSGTEALRLAIVGVMGEGDGDSEIITVSHTFAATVEAIIAARYRPVLVDVDPATYLMDLGAAQAACTPRTVGVVPVHLYGQMVDMQRMRSLADRHGLAVVEDASQAHGALHNNCRPGQLSDAASFSFFPGKNIGAFGDAGAVVTRDDAVAESIAQLSDHGRCDKFTHTRIGANSRMDAIQAAVLGVKLPHLDVWNDARRTAACRYDAKLAHIGECATPSVCDEAHHVYHQYVVQVSHRDALQPKLRERGIQTGIHYPIPVHEQPAYRHLVAGPESLPVTHELCGRILSLPIYPEITDEMVERVATELLSCLPQPACNIGHA